MDIPRDHPEPSTVQVDAAAAMIKRLRMKFDPEDFDNPVIQTHYKNLEAMALDKVDRDEIDDHTGVHHANADRNCSLTLTGFVQFQTRKRFPS